MSHSPSDTKNPLILVKETEEHEERRVAEAKATISAEEQKKMAAMKDELKAADTRAREEGQAALKEFAKTEPVRILKAGAESAAQEIAALTKRAEAKKKTIVDALVEEVVTGSPKA